MKKIFLIVLLVGVFFGYAYFMLNAGGATPPFHRKPIAISVDKNAGIWVVCNDGSVWFLLDNKGPWTKAPALPQIKFRKG